MACSNRIRRIILYMYRQAAVHDPEKLMHLTTLMLHPRQFIFLARTSEYCAEERQPYDHRRPVDRRKLSSFGVTEQTGYVHRSNQSSQAPSLRSRASSLPTPSSSSAAFLASSYQKHTASLMAMKPFLPMNLLQPRPSLTGVSVLEPRFPCIPHRAHRPHLIRTKHA